MAEYSWPESFQRKVITLMIREPGKTLDLVEPEYFSSPMLVDISRIVKEIYSHHKKDAVELSRSTLSVITKAWLGRKKRDLWRGYRQEIRSIYSDQIKDQVVVLNQVIDFSRDMKFRDALVSGERDVNARRYDRAIQRFQDLKNFGQEDPDDLGIEYWAGITATDRWREDRSNIVGTTYFPTLDRAMGGGVSAGDLVIVLTNPKVGQSTLLGSIAAGAMWRRKTVAIASGEISAKRYRRRIDALMSGISSKDLAKRKFRKRARRRLKLARRQAKGQLFIKQFPTGRAKISDIEAWIGRLEEKGHKIDLLIVDYLYLFQPNQSSKERRINIGQAAVDLRGLAVVKGFGVYTASKGNRAALEKEILGPKDFAEDISQFWTLDFMLALCQSKAEREHHPETARLILTYARDFRGGVEVPVTINREIYSVQESKHGS